MKWKKSTIFSMIILLSIDTSLTNEYSNKEITCSFKKVSCLNETSFKFCFSAGSITYLYGEIKNCPQGTICSENEGINACIELINFPSDNSIEVTTYPLISSEQTIALPPIVTTIEAQTTESSSIIEPSSPKTFNYMVQSTFPFYNTEENTKLEDVPFKYEFSTDQSTYTLSTNTEEIFHKNDSDTQELSLAVTHTRDTFPTTSFITPSSSTTHDHSPKVTEQKRKPIIHSKTSTPHHLSKVTKQERKSTTTTPYYSSKVTKRKRKSTTLATGHHSSKITKKRRKATSPVSIHTQSSKITIRKRKSTTPSTHDSSKITKQNRKTTTPVSVHAQESKITKRKRKSTTPSMYSSSKIKEKRKSTIHHSTTFAYPTKHSSSTITPDYSLKVTTLGWKSTTEKLRKQPFSSADTVDFITSILPSDKINSSEIVKTSSTENKMTTITYSNTFQSKNSMNEDKTNTYHEVSTLSSSSTNNEIENRSSSQFVTPMEQSTSTLFPCQDFLLKFLTKTTPDNALAVKPFVKEDNSKQVVEELTPPSACTSSGKYPSKKCNEYYECLKVMWWYRLMYRKCRKSERFDSINLQCVPDSSCI